MAAINFPTATSNGQTFTADTGVIYTYIGTPPNGFWSGTFGTTGLATLDGRFVALNDGNSIQTMQTQGLKFNNGSADTILLDGVNGKVGIGTTLPSALLHISKTVNSGDVGLIVQNTGNSSNTASIYLNKGSGAEPDHRIQNDTGGNLTFARGIDESSYTEQMRIDSSGKVGIGVTSPNVNLEVNNTFRVSRDGSQGTYLELFGGSSSADPYLNVPSGFGLPFRINGSEAMRIDSSGNVGIGSTDPSGDGWSAANDLVINSTGNSGMTIKSGASSFGQLDFNDAAGGLRGFVAYGHADDYLGLGTAGAERMRITSTGNVGIGTSTPTNSNSGSTLLHLHNTDTSGVAPAEIKFTNGITGQVVDGGLITYYDRSLYMWNYESYNLLFGTSGTEQMRIDSSGNVLFSQSASSNYPEQKLKWSNDSTTTNGFYISQDSSRNGRIFHEQGLDILFGTSNTERMRIDSSGRVGIATAPYAWEASSNSQALQVRTGVLWDYLSVQFDVGRNYYYDGAYKYGTSSTAERITFHNGNIMFSNAASGSANGALTWQERMRIISNGNIGMGTTAPTALLHVTNSSGGGSLSVGDNGATQYQYINLGSGTSGQKGWQVGRAGTGATFAPAGGFYIYDTENSVTRLGIDSSGNVGIGGNPSNFSTQQSLSIYAGSSSVGRIDFYNGSSRIGEILSYSSNGEGIRISALQSQAVTFETNSVQRMRVNASGEVRAVKSLVASDGHVNQMYAGNSGVGMFNKDAYSNCGEHLEIGSSAVKGWAPIYINKYSWSSGLDARLQAFYINGAHVGGITHTGSSTGYNTTSDYRLKENVVDLTAAIPRLKTLPVHRFNFISNSELTVDGFLAHEAQLVVPESVTGTHNEVDGDGNPVMQSIDQAKLVPLLTAALQEAIGRIETLETEVAALKAG